MFLDEQVQNLTRRLRNIEQNPRPEYLRCNKIRFEAELENYLDVLDAWKSGKPFAMFHGLEQLTRAMGLKGSGYIDWGDRVRDPQRYMNIAVGRFGFPEHTCDRTMTALGLFLSGEVPLPRLMTSHRVPCDPIRWSTTAAAKYAGVLFFELSRLNSCDYENLCCVAEQVAELIDFSEKSVPGVKYDEDKLIEDLEIDAQAARYMQDTYELRKRVPCPISPQDAFHTNRVPSRYPNPRKVLEYYRLYRDELYERAEKGKGGVPEEKLRIAWLATGPYGRTTFDLLTRKGVSLPWFHIGAAARTFGLVRSEYGDASTYGRKLTPLQELVRDWNTNTWAGNIADPWIDTLITACRDLKIDAVVDFLQAGCIVTKNVKRITAQRVWEELGIPTLDVEGRELVANETAQAEMNHKLEEFIDMCIANKK